MSLDLVWTIPELALTASVVGIPFVALPECLIFVFCGLSVTLIQRRVAGDPWQWAILKGSLLGLLAALPFSVVGVIVGAGVGFLRILPDEEDQSARTDDIPQDEPHTWTDFREEQQANGPSALNPDHKADIDAEFFRAWQQFEGLVNEHLPASYRSTKMIDKLEELRKARVLSSAQMAAAHRYRFLRNNIVHPELNHSGKKPVVEPTDLQGLQLLCKELIQRRQWA